MKRIDDQIWAGTSRNFFSVKEAEEAFTSALAAGWSEPGKDSDEEDDEHDLLQVVGNIGVIHISGGLVNEGGGYLKYYGLTGYPQIKAAISAAARNAEVKHIVLNIDSGGGSVSGCQDTGDFIRKIHTNLKPVSAFTGGSMASAAYWLGSSAGKVYAAETAVVGSIGVLATHKEYSKMYKDAGIGVTVVRSGPYKALANSVEPLSAEGEAQLQKLVNATSRVFNRHVATMRNRTEEYVDSTMGQGREFVGAEAADVGLVDGITSIDALLSQLQREYIDTQAQHLDTKPRQIGGFGATTNTENEMLDQEIDKLKAEQAGAKKEDPPAADVPTVDAAKDAVKSDDALTQLTGMLERANAQVAELNQRLATAESTVKGAMALIDPLKAIVAKSVSNMRVAMNGTPLAAELSASQLLAEHEALAGEFEKKFPAGGLAAVTPAAEQKTKTVMSGLENARLNSVLNK